MIHEAMQRTSVSPFKRTRSAKLLAYAMLIVFGVAMVPSIRMPLLRAAGWALVIQDPLKPAEIIVVSVNAGSAGVLEAADLVRDGIASRVAIFTDPPSGEDLEFIRRGLPYEDAGARQIRQLTSLGITDVVQILRTTAGTTGESETLPAWCDQNKYQSIVYVSARDHSRRSRRVLDRAMKGHATSIMVQPSHYSTFDPDRWWLTREGIRTELFEIQKLAFDYILHPLS